MVQALAYLRGRNYVLPVDIEDVFIDVEAHRIQLNGKARVNRVTAEQVLKDILEGTTKPSVVKNRKNKLLYFGLLVVTLYLAILYDSPMLLGLCLMEVVLRSYQLSCYYGLRHI